MKIKIISILILYILTISPLYAGYSKMNKVFKEYTPPEYFSTALEFESKGKGSDVEENQNLNNTFSSIEKIQRSYEKQLNQDHEIFFLSGIDDEVYNRLSDISYDSASLEKIISENLILQEIEIIAGIRNPGVLAAREQVKAELESFNQVMSLDENLKQYSAFTEGINTKVGPLKMKESAKQKYPFQGLTSLKGQIITQQVAVLTEKISIAKKNVITQIRKAYWDIVFVEQSLAVTAETISAFNRLKGVATALYRSGRTSYQDIIKINIRLEILKENLVTLSSKKRNIEVQLLELINLPLNTKIGRVIVQNPHKKILNPDVLYPLARLERQELKVIRHKIKKIEGMIKMAESMIQEPLTLGFSTYEDEAVNMVGTGASKPGFQEKTMAAMKNKNPVKPWYGIDDPWLNQTKQKLLSLNQILVNQENYTDKMVRDAWFGVDKNIRELNLYKTRVLPLSKSALNVTTREYEAGSIPFSQTIDSYTYWLKVKLTIAKKQTDLGISTANLEKIIGTSF